MPTDNGWAEYQKLVLAELERHNKWLNAIDEKLNATLLTFSVERKAVETLMKMVEQLDARVGTLEEVRAANDAVANANEHAESAKKWVIGLSVTTVVALVAMTVDVLSRALL